MDELELHPRRWGLKFTRARCEICERERTVLRLEVREDDGDSIFVCPEHELPADMAHPMRPEIYIHVCEERTRRVA